MEWNADYENIAFGPAGILPMAVSSSIQAEKVLCPFSFHSLKQRERESFHLKVQLNLVSHIVHGRRVWNSISLCSIGMDAHWFIMLCWSSIYLNKKGTQRLLDSGQPEPCHNSDSRNIVKSPVIASLSINSIQFQPFSYYALQIEFQYNHKVFPLNFPSSEGLAPVYFFSMYFPFHLPAWSCWWWWWVN